MRKGDLHETSPKFRPCPLQCLGKGEFDSTPSSRLLFCLSLYALHPVYEIRVVTNCIIRLVSNNYTALCIILVTLPLRALSYLSRCQKLDPLAAVHLLAAEQLTAPSKGIEVVNPEAAPLRFQGDPGQAVLGSVKLRHRRLKSPFCLEP